MTENSSVSPTAEPKTDRPGWKFGFWSLIVTQFQNAFNDNAIKFLVIYIIVAMNFAPAYRDKLVFVVGGLFAFPFILFSLAGGYFADRYSKRSVVIGTKLMEIIVMAVAIAGLAAHNLPVECAAVFLISTQSALFGPSKYGLLPELLAERRLSWGNGIIELGTFIGSITAVMASGYLAEKYHGREAMAGVILLGCTCVGLATSFGISRVPAADPARKFRWNPFGDLYTQMKTITGDRVLGWAVLGNTYLWFLAALLQFTIVIYGHDVLRVDDTQISYLQAAVGIGIGLGSFAAGYLSDGKIEYGLIPLGAMGMTVFGALLYFPQPSAAIAHWAQSFLFNGAGAFTGRLIDLVSTVVRLRLPDLWLLGFSAGFFAVPLNALIQHRPRPEEKGGVIAAGNLLSFVGVFLAAGAYYLFSSVFHQTPAGIFLDGAILTLVTTAYSIYLAAGFAAATGAVDGDAFHLSHPRRGPRQHSGKGRRALRLQPHVVGGRAAADCVDRPADPLPYVQGHLRSAVRKAVRENHSRDSDFVRTAPARNAAIAARSEQAPSAGEVVCIFAEGQITRIGQMLPFRRGFERIMKGVDAPIIPVALDGVWGSIFSFEHGRFVWKLPRCIPYPVTVSFGKPMPPTSTPFEVREAVQELQTEAYGNRKEPLAHAPSHARPHGAPSSFSLCHGRQATTAHEVGRGAAELPFFWRDACEKLGRTGNGRHSASAIRAGRAREFRGDALRKDSGEFELHIVERNARIVCRAMQNRDSDHHEIVAREASRASARKNNLVGRGGGFAIAGRKAHRAACSGSCRVDVGACSGGRQKANARRSRHCNFLQRKHRRTERRDADALQHRVQHRAIRPDVHARTRKIACWGCCRSSIPSDSR